MGRRMRGWGYHRGYYGSQGGGGCWGGRSSSWASHGSYGSCGYVVRRYRIYRRYSARPYSDYQSHAYRSSRIASGIQRPFETSQLGVHVPENATVFVNGRRTDSEGTYREFELHTRKPRHSYRVRAVASDNGREFDQTKVAILTARRSGEISFDFDSTAVSNAPREPTDAGQQLTQKSSLTVRVPDSATVYVNGRRTNSTGIHREYELRTRKSRHSYRVRAVVNKDGLEVSETKLVILDPGSSTKMSFDFDSDIATNSEAGSKIVGPVRVFKTLQAQFAARYGSKLVVTKAR